MKMKMKMKVKPTKELIEENNNKYKRGAWSKDEDEKLRRAVDTNGTQNWVEIQKLSGLARPPKNCRLRWFNYLRPNLKKSPFTEHEEKEIVKLHAKYGNSWSRIANELPGRTDNEVKNFWHKRSKRTEQEAKNDEKLVNEVKNMTTNALPNTPSQPPVTSNSSQSTETPLYNPHEEHNGASSNKKAQILTSPQGFSRKFLNETSDVSPQGHSASGSHTPTTTDVLLPMYSSFTFKTELPSIQFNAQKQELEVEAETETDVGILEELRKAQARVCFLKRMLRQRGYSNKKAMKNSRKKDVMKRISKRKTGVLLIKKSGKGNIENSDSETDTRDESTETEELTQGEDNSLCENSKRNNKATTFQEQNHSIDSFNHNPKSIMESPSFCYSWDDTLCKDQVPAGRNFNESSSIEGLPSESSTILQDSFLMVDLFGNEAQYSPLEQTPSIGAFGLISDKNTQGNHLNPIENEWYGNNLGPGISYGPERGFTEEQNLMQGSSSSFNYMGTKPKTGYGYTGGEQYSRNAWKQELSREQNLWPERTMVSQEQKHATYMEQKDSYNENTEEVLGQDLDYEVINMMPEELSSMLEFFPTTIQIPDWYSNGNTMQGTEASNELNMPP